MPFQEITLAIPAAGDTGGDPLEYHGIQLLRRPHDNGVVVTNSECTGVHAHDVIVSLNGIPLRNVSGGIDDIYDIFGEHGYSIMTVVIHRANVGGEYLNRCCFVDQDTESRCSYKKQNNQFKYCTKHGRKLDAYRCKNKRDSDGFRCIYTAKKGCNGYCGVCCYSGVINLTSNGGDCHPPSVLLETMEKFLNDDDSASPMYSSMSESQLKIMRTLHEIRKKMTRDRFQPESYSVDKILSKLVAELVKEHLTDEKYDQQVWYDGSWKPIKEIVKSTLLTAFKGALKDFGGDGMDYEGLLSRELVNEIINNTFNFFKDVKKCVGDDGLLVVKAGSGGVMGSAGLASNRRVDQNTYHRDVYDVDSWTGLGLRGLGRNERGLAERFTSMLLLGLGIGGNIDLPGAMIPDTDRSATSDLYFMTSNQTSVPMHHANLTIAKRAPRAPPGMTLVPTSQLRGSPTVPTAATNTSVGVNNNAVVPSSLTKHTKTSSKDRQARIRKKDLLFLYNLYKVLSNDDPSTTSSSSSSVEGDPQSISVQLNQQSSGTAAASTPEPNSTPATDGNNDQQPCNPNIIKWLPHGKGWAILDKKLFEKNILGYIMPNVQYATFVQRLNRYKFLRISSGAEIGAYYHPFFKRGKPDLLHLINETHEIPIHRYGVDVNLAVSSRNQWSVLEQQESVERARLAQERARQHVGHLGAPPAAAAAFVAPQNPPPPPPPGVAFTFGAPPGQLQFGQLPYSVIAPPGPLGLFIKNSPSGDTFIDKVYDTSPLKHKVRVGDKIVKINGVDTSKISSAALGQYMTPHLYRTLVLLRDISKQDNYAVQQRSASVAQALKPPADGGVKKPKVCGACGQTGHNRGNATQYNCSAYYDPKEAERREKQMLQQEQMLQRVYTNSGQQRARSATPTNASSATNNNTKGVTVAKDMKSFPQMLQDISRQKRMTQKKQQGQCSSTPLTASMMMNASRMQQPKQRPPMQMEDISRQNNRPQKKQHGMMQQQQQQQQQQPTMMQSDLSTEPLPPNSFTSIQKPHDDDGEHIVGGESLQKKQRVASPNSVMDSHNIAENSTTSNQQPSPKISNESETEADAREEDGDDYDNDQFSIGSFSCDSVGNREDSTGNGKRRSSSNVFESEAAREEHDGSLDSIELDSLGGEHVGWLDGDGNELGSQEGDEAKDVDFDPLSSHDAQHQLDDLSISSFNKAQDLLLNSSFNTLPATNTAEQAKCGASLVESMNKTESFLRQRSLLTPDQRAPLEEAHNRQLQAIQTKALIPGDSSASFFSGSMMNTSRMQQPKQRPPMQVEDMPRKNRFPQKKQHGMMQQQQQQKSKPQPSPKGVQSTDDEYAKALAFLRKRADETPLLPSAPADVKLIEEGDSNLLSDYFYFIMQQLAVCRLSEQDRKTRGGKRQDVAVGYGGLQCIHCAPAPSSRKFFWSNADRLANSFAGIPDHVLTCKLCPEEVTEALLVLKGRHNAQMKSLPRGTQKQFFRRMWRRLHAGDESAKAAATGVGSQDNVAALKSPNDATADTLKRAVTLSSVETAPLEDDTSKAADISKPKRKADETFLEQESSDSEEGNIVSKSAKSTKKHHLDPPSRDPRLNLAHVQWEAQLNKNIEQNLFVRVLKRFAAKHGYSHIGRKKVEFEGAVQVAVLGMTENAPLDVSERVCKVWEGIIGD